MVVDTVEAGQQCIEYLRKNNVGRANFIVLDRLPERDLTPVSTPENAPRLFDLVKPKDPRFAAAFYSVLHDTIVAKDLTQANRVAYGAKRWRVVTLEGGLIDKSGTMTGGGTKVSRGGMSDKLVANMSKETVSKLEKDRDVLEAEYAQFRAEQAEMEKNIALLEKRGPELEMQQSKLSLEISALGKAMEDGQKQLTELKYSLCLFCVNIRSQTVTIDKKQLSTLESKISKLQSDVDKLHAETSGIENEIKALQEKIMEVGGVKLRSQKAKVDDLRDQITTLNDRITTCDVARVKNQKDCEKFTKLMKSSEEELETLAEELSELEEDMKESARNAEQIRKKADDLEHVRPLELMGC
jgi:structural maintenance of chromosome 4